MGDYNFMKACLETYIGDPTFNASYTENGGLGYATTGKHLLDMNFKVSSLRNTSENDIKNMFLEAYNENQTLAIVWLFFVRDIREGLGERKLFRSLVPYIIEYVEKKFPKEKDKRLTAFGIFSCVLEYGRGDDLYSFVDTNFESYVFEYMKQVLESDLNRYEEDKQMNTLLFKWMKSEHSTNEETKRLARKTRLAFKMTPKEYRQYISKGRKALNIVECKMCAKEWGEINYEHVPSKAGLLYRNSFLKHDAERYKEYISKVLKGEAKKNSKDIYPYEITYKYIRNPRKLEAVDASLEADWKTIVKHYRAKTDLKNTLVVADGSGSMTWARVSNDSDGPMALDVANALAILFSQLNKGYYANSYITFSSKPQFVQLGEDDMLLKDKMKIALKYDECSNTNIEAVFNLILNTAIDHNLKQEDMPENILILSDMEFDEGSDHASKAIFQTLADKYAEHGYKLPRLVFWNLCSRTGTIPVVQNDLGVALVSGFSPNILDMVMSNETDPYKCLLNKLESDRYKYVWNVLEKEPSRNI